MELLADTRVCNLQATAVRRLLLLEEEEEEKMVHYDSSHTPPLACASVIRVCAEQHDVRKQAEGRS